MWTVIILIIDQIIKAIVEYTKPNINLIKEIFNIIYAQNTGRNVWEF